MLNPIKRKKLYKAVEKMNPTMPLASVPDHIRTDPKYITGRGFYRAGQEAQRDADMAWHLEMLKGE